MPPHGGGTGLSNGYGGGGALLPLDSPAAPPGTPRRRFFTRYGYGGSGGGGSGGAFTLSPARQFILLVLLVLALFYGFASSFHARMAKLEDQQAHQVRLQPQRPGKGQRLGRGQPVQPPPGLPAGEEAGPRGVELGDLGPLAVRAAAALKARYTGPLDLDAAAAARADELAAAWAALDPKERTLTKRPGMYLSYPEVDPPYPFQRVKRQDGSDTGVLAIIAPFYDTNFYRAEAARALFWRLKSRGHILLGISSYQEFPGAILNPYDDRHTTVVDSREVLAHVDGWLHCSRVPDAVLPPGVPRILLSESDFHFPDRRDAGGSLIPWGLPKKYDVVYSNQGAESSNWHDFCRNWTLAKASFIRIASEMPTVKIAVLGRNLTSNPLDADLLPFVRSGQVEELPANLPWRDFLKVIEGSRLLMAPNLHDASPRVVVEALCMDVPVLMNRAIVGGWKYVTPDSGEFFTDEHDVVPAVRALLSPERRATLRPRAWFREHWGFDRATLLLQGFLEAAVGPERLAAARAVVEPYNRAANFI